MAEFKTRLESFKDRLDLVSPTPAVLNLLLRELVDILIQNQRDRKKAEEKKAEEKKAEEKTEKKGD